MDKYQINEDLTPNTAREFLLEWSFDISLDDYTKYKNKDGSI